MPGIDEKLTFRRLGYILKTQLEIIDANLSLWIGTDKPLAILDIARHGVLPKQALGAFC